MISKPFVAAFLAAGCVGAAAGGAYVAVRQNANDSVNGASVTVSTPVASAPAAAAAPADTKPVSETEAVVSPAPPKPATPAPSTDIEAASSTPQRPAGPQVARASKPQERPVRRDPPARTASRPTASPAPQRPAPIALPTATPDSGAPVQPARTEPVQAVVPDIPEAPPAPPEPQFVQVVLPASSVIGLHVETSLSSERARLEDRVDARVTRDVSAAGRVAIPAGSRVIGSVIMVERGGKLKERARLGVRFHTLVFANGSEQPIRTDAIYREGESPGGESARKIGGATVGGAILGAILGGGKGAAIGSAAGAAGGTAAVMAGDRNAASLPAGTIVTVRLAEPVSVEVEKRASEL
jgi:hypothetical protein